MKKRYLILTSTTEHFIESLQKKGLSIILSKRNKEGKRFFPDGEVYVRLAEIKRMRKRGVIILHSGMPRPNDGLMELELILMILKENGVKTEVFFTYFPYGRQDKIFSPGETNVSENLIKKLIKFYKVKKIYTLEAHFGERDWLKKYPIKNISLFPFLKEKVKEDFEEEILFLATDKGGQRRFKIPGFIKKRKDSFRVEMRLSEKVEKLAKERIVCLVDDLLATGTTLLKAKKEIERLDPKRIISLFSHCLFEEGYEKIKKSFSKIYFTNTIYHPRLPQIDISPLIIKTLED